MSVLKHCDDDVKKSVLSKLNNKIHDYFGFKTEIEWFDSIAIVSYHIIGAIWCYYYAFPAKWQTVLFAIFMYYFTFLGVTVAVHRYWSHRTFKATLPCQLLMIVMYASAGQNSIMKWVRDHRTHHKHSDTLADPHSISRGFFFAHIGWFMMKRHPDVIKAGKQVNLDDLYADPLVMFQERHFRKMKIIFCFVLPTLINIVFWGERWQTVVAWQWFIRYVIFFHGVFTVNSLAHMYGIRPYKKDINPRENWLVELITVGEGYHNYHHAFPYDHRNAESVSWTNISTILVKLWELLGLAYDLRVASPNVVDACAEKTGDGTRKSDAKMNGFAKLKRTNSE